MMLNVKVDDFYKNQTIFITGGTGFLGKALIEKLIRCCPNVGNIYVLLRAKKGANVQERLDKLLNEDVFLRLKSNDTWKSKIKPLVGNVNKLNCDISEDDIKLLKENVNIIFHCAATVRFDDPLQEAILTNTRGTREICKLALEMTNIKILTYVSTAYCNMDKPIIEEIVYPSPAKWQEMIALCEETDPSQINYICNKLLQNFPNTYVFAKALSEHVVNDMCKDKIPTLILRPSIVIGAISEPMPGWADNFNGPYGICLGTGKGILHAYLGEKDVRLNVLPIDTVVQGILMASYYKLNRDYDDIDRNDVNDDDVKSIKELEVYNMCSENEKLLSLEQVQDVCIELIVDYPLAKMLWHPFLYITCSKYFYFLLVVVYHLLPALLIDGIMNLLGTKPFLFKLQRKIYIANTVLMPFSSNEWIFKSDNFKKLIKRVNSDRTNCDSFIFREVEDYKEMFFNSIIASRLYLLNEGYISDSDKRRAFRLRVLHYTVKYLLIFALFYYLFIKCDIVNIFTRCLINYWNGIKLN